MNTRVYLCNMAVSDIMMCLTAATITPYTAFTGRWDFGSIFCHLFPLCQVRCTDRMGTCTLVVSYHLTTGSKYLHLQSVTAWHRHGPVPCGQHEPQHRQPPRPRPLHRRIHQPNLHPPHDPLLHPHAGEQYHSFSFIY